MAWDSVQVDAAQNAVPTDFSALDAQLAGRSDFNANRFANDDKLHVTFFMRPLLNEEKSALAQRPIYEDREFIQIMIPGDKQNIIMRVADDYDRQRFPAHYEKFKAGKEQVLGTPLTHTGVFPASKCEEYQHFGIRTVEQLAAAADNIAPRFHGFHQDKQAAQAWLNKQSSNETLLAQIQALQAQVATMQVRNGASLKSGTGYQQRRELI